MKIGIISDFHFGYPRFYEDTFSQAERALTDATEKSDIVIIAGDLFDAKMPKQDIYARVFDIFKSVSQDNTKKKIRAVNLTTGERVEVSNTKMIAIHGTHERRAKEFVNPIQMMEKAGFLVNAHNNCIIYEDENEKITIQGMGGVPENFAKTAMKSMNFMPLRDAFNILVFHQTLQELVPTKTKEFISIEDLPTNFDLYINGHIHWKKEMKVNGIPLILPGSTVITQLKKNEQETKGWYLFDTNTKKAEFMPIKTRPFVYRELSFENAELKEIYETCKNEIEKEIKKGDKPIIKLKLSGKLPKGIGIQDVNTTQIVQEYQDRAIVEIERDFEFEGLKEQIDFLQKVKSGEISIKEQGMEILTKKLKEYGGSTDGLEEIFELLSDEKRVDEAIAKLTQK